MRIKYENLQVTVYLRVLKYSNYIIKLFSTDDAIDCSNPSFLIHI